MQSLTAAPVSTDLPPSASASLRADLTDALTTAQDVADALSDQQPSRNLNLARERIREARAHLEAA